MTEPAQPAVQSAKAGLGGPKRILPLVFTLGLGVALSVAAFLLVQRSERQRVEAEFDWRARSQGGTLRTILDGYEETLHSLRNVFDASGNVSYGEFRLAAADLRERHPGIHLLQWLPLVRHAQRATFEQQARTQVWPHYVINQGQGGYDPATETLGPMTPVEEQAEYLPIHYIEPPEGNEVAFGFDHFQGGLREVVQSALEHGRMAASRRVQLRDPQTMNPARERKEFGWVFLLPVYERARQPATPAERRTQLRGFVEGAFRLSDLVRRSVGPPFEGSVEMLLLDRTPGEKEPYLISFNNTEWTASPPPTVADFQSAMHRELPLNVGGRAWSVFFRPAPSWLATQSSPYPAAILGSGLLVTGLLGFLVHSTQRRAELVARLVRERTAELRATQEALREDIRRREAVQKALRESEDRYRAFVEQSTEAIWRFELEQPIPIHLPVQEQIDRCYRFCYLAECNDAMAQMYGFYRSTEMVGARLADMLPQSDPDNIAYLGAMIENGYRIADRESREMDRDGQTKYFLNNLTGIVEDGQVKRAWGTQRDITERKRQNELQIEQDTRLRLAVSAASLGTWDWDLRTGRIVWSAEAERMYGLEPGGFDGRPETFFNLIHPDDRERVRDIIRRALDQPDESVGTYELRVLRPDGRMRWLVARGAVLRDDEGRPIRRLGTVMDVTAHHLAEVEKTRMEHKLQETQKLESLGILAGGIAHDFNNLLTGILGNASLARLDLPANSPAQISLEQIELVAQRAADLCKQMLAYSGKGRFIVQSLDLSTLVRDTTDLLRLSISKSAVLKFALQPDLPAISADATQMRQILMNLIINASEAIGDRSGVITISTGLLHADRAYLTEAYLSPNIPESEYVFLEVSDNGVGMDAETRARIFDPFFTTKFTGRGLGLAAVLGIVRGHSGALKVYSEPGRGTTFKLLLPRANGPAEQLPANPSPGSTWRGHGTMLVVDDEETVRAVSARMLTGMGFEVLLASNGQEALEIFLPRRTEIVGVLLDLTMPRLDGTATFTELRRLQPAIRVLLMSGFNEQDAVNRFAGKGLAGFLQKPFKPETLQARLRAIFESDPESPANLSLDPPPPGS